MKNTRDIFHFPGRYTVYEMEGTFWIVDRDNGGCIVNDSPRCGRNIRLATAMLKKYKREHNDMKGWKDA